MSLRRWFLERCLNRTRERIAALEIEVETLSSLRVVATKDFETGITTVHDKPLGLSKSMWMRVAGKRGKLAALRAREVRLTHIMIGGYPESVESKTRRGYNSPPTVRIEPPDSSVPPPPVWAAQAAGLVYPESEEDKTHAVRRLLVMCSDGRGIVVTLSQETIEALAEAYKAEGNTNE